MENTKLKEKVANAFNSFFSDENSAENNDLDFSNRFEVSSHETSAESFEKYGWFLRFLRQAVFFFPATFILHVLSMACGIILVYRPPFLGPPRFPSGYMVLAFLVSIFMAWFGLGELRKLKHAVIPLSIIATSLIFGLISGGLMSLSSDFIGIVSKDLFPLCLFPFALVIPFLAKGWVDQKE